MDLETLIGRLGDYTRDAVCITEAEPIDEPGPRIVWVNQAFTDMTGYTREDVLGKTPRILQGEDVDRAALKRIRDALKAWRPVRETLKNYTKAGEPFWVELDIQPIADEDGWHHYWLAVQRDVTERFEQGRALAAARDEAERANRLKSEFLATMSHEIRTPLNGVLGMAQVLKLTDLDEKQQRAVRTIIQSGQSLVGLIDEILDISRIEAGGLSLEKRVIAPVPLLADAASAVEGVVRKKGVDLTVDAGGCEAVRIEADPKRLRQVLINLAGNAVKFSDDGAVTLSCEALDGHVRFSVSDQGPGVAPDQQVQIFERFYQIDGSMTREHGGAGLGLAIARDIVEAHGGRIGVDSTLGEGATFWAEIPRAPDASASDAPQKGKALIVEDNPVNRLVLEDGLGLAGWEVHAAEDGREALGALSRERFDVAVFDQQMPRMCGDEAIRAFRRSGHADAARMPIVMLTAHAAASDRENALEAGANAFLAKPVDLEALDGALTRLVAEGTDEEAP